MNPRPTAVTLPPLAEPVAVSVVVPARQAAGLLTGAVAAVLAQDPPPDEVLIAVGPSTDRTEAEAAALARDHSEVRVVANPSGRTADGLNRAISAARGRVLVRVDAGARLPAGYLAGVVSALRRTGAANVGGRQVPVAEAGFARCVAAAMRSPVGAGGAAHRTGRHAGPVDTVYLGAFRREALDVVGGFDPAFVRNQDAELNLRLRAAGYEVHFEPALAVGYRPRGSVRALASQYWQYGRWRRATVRRHRGSLRARQLAPAVLVVGLVGAAGLSVALASPWPIAVVGGGYLVGILGAAAVAAEDPGAWPGTALALATMHLTWGAGFLLGPPRAATAASGRATADEPTGSGSPRTTAP